MEQPRNEEKWKAIKNAIATTNGHSLAIDVMTYRQRIDRDGYDLPTAWAKMQQEGENKSLKRKIEFVLYCLEAMNEVIAEQPNNEQIDRIRQNRQILKDFEDELTGSRKPFGVIKACLPRKPLDFCR